MSNLTETKEILQKLVSYPILGGESNLAIADYIISILTAHEVPYQVAFNADKTKKLIHAKIGPDVDGGVILSGHTDVVPVIEQSWDTDPFELVEKEGKWYARGSCDMKGFLACCLASIPVFKKAKLERPVYFAFSYDEEIGCLSGYLTAEAIRDFYTEKPAYALIGEATLMQPVNGHKGICVVKTTILGSAGHSSRVLQEVSAVHTAAKLIVWIENKMSQFETEDSFFDPKHTTMHVGKVIGGTLANVIAEKCEFFWDIRVIPEDKVEVILDDFYAYCTTLEEELKLRFEGAKIINELQHPPVPPLGTSLDAKIIDITKYISGINSVGKVAYATEAGQFSETGFEAIVCGPGDIAQAHRANEFVSIDQIEKCLKMLEKLAISLEYIEEV